MNILFTAFTGTSSEQFLRQIGQKGLFLPSNEIMDAKMLTEEISTEKYDYVFSFGQKPNIKDKVYIEWSARSAEGYLKTAFDCEGLAKALRQQQMEVKISNFAGTSFCNSLYWNGLDYLWMSGLKVKMVFLHIPMRKNITDFEMFAEKLWKAVNLFLVTHGKCA